uniref:PHD-type domain-containing protein n=1 Tax=Macrostomum lignano TaxID=282301 RepID=A0A1I8FDA0_9PLAT
LSPCVFFLGSGKNPWSLTTSTQRSIEASIRRDRATPAPPAVYRAVEPGRAARSARTPVLLARCSARCSCEVSCESLRGCLASSLWRRCSWRVLIGEVLLARWLLARCCSWRGALGEVLLARLLLRGASCEVLLGEVLLARVALGEVLLGERAALARCSWRGAPWRGALARCSRRRCSCEVLLATVLGWRCEVLLARCSCEVLLFCEVSLGECSGELVLASWSGCKVLLARCSWRGAPAFRCSLVEVPWRGGSWRGAAWRRRQETLAGLLASAQTGSLRLKILDEDTPGLEVWTAAPVDECPACFCCAGALPGPGVWAPEPSLPYVGPHAAGRGQKHVFEQNCARHNLHLQSPSAAWSSSAAVLQGWRDRHSVTGASGPMHCVCQRDSDGSFTPPPLRQLQNWDIRTGEAKQKGQQVTTNCRTEEAVRKRGQVPGRGLGSYVEVGAPATTERDGAVLHCTCGGTNAYVNCRSPLCKERQRIRQEGRRESDGENGGVMFVCDCAGLEGYRNCLTKEQFDNAGKCKDIEGRYVDRGQRYRVRYGGVRYECTCDGDNRGKECS